MVASLTSAITCDSRAELYSAIPCPVQYVLVIGTQKGKGRIMRGRSRRRDVGGRRTPQSRGAFQFGRVLVAALIILVLVVVIVRLID
jgi:hypothetical protein